MIKGKFIVIDGIDGSGKATQTNFLVERLKKEGFAVEVADFPQYGKKSAALVEEYLEGKFGKVNDVDPYIASLFYACDRYEASFKIKKWLEEGKIVVANRYISSNIGHQGAKLEDGKEKNEYFEWLENMEFNIFKIPKPDLTIILYVKPEIGQKLVDQKANYRDYLGEKKRDIHEENLKHLIDASNSYLYAARKFNWIVIDCLEKNHLKSKEEIHNLIWEKIRNILK
ncbi:dTMP kinase [Candidatus Pacearchaeota archaeon CG_4_9_14_3_um_filter_31_7]|nr:MAG: dTMP kinase [Candidatus Pacearchaeota archaeon CG10_big_fil_rev_8_21_14_0_10_31_59]PIZ81216.1 MAG: dTMP kinase [Candidatus Pacearchaeota archaeon CG_4_10_14_0_2_um_filter_31_10]PJA70455.1 MAG: dTMP kinase [Candidatus Pacearchaeota archaeon CG_4_9_14_3_um_filter_31_7]